MKDTWNEFWKSGKVNDYLSYCSSTLERTNTRESHQKLCNSNSLKGNVSHRKQLGERITYG